MWVHTRPRNEHENAILINLNQASRINISKLGEKWFIEVMIGSEAFPIATAQSLEEAADLMKQVFEALKADEKALDLETNGNETSSTSEAQPAEQKESAIQ